VCAVKISARDKASEFHLPNLPSLPDQGAVNLFDSAKIRARNRDLNETCVICESCPTIVARTLEERVKI
jgi:hypothetical protein